MLQSELTNALPESARREKKASFYLNSAVEIEFSQVFFSLEITWLLKCSNRAGNIYNSSKAVSLSDLSV